MPTGELYTAQHIPGAALTTYELGGDVILGRHAEIKEQVRTILTGRAPAAVATTARG